MKLPAAISYGLKGPDGEGGDAAFEQAVASAIALHLAEHEKASVLAGIFGIIVIGLTACFLSEPLWFAPIIALRLACMVNNYIACDRIIAAVAQELSPDAALRRFDFAMTVNAFSWGLVVWPIAAIFIVDPAAHLIVIATSVAFGILAISVAVRVRAMALTLGPFALTALIPLVLVIPEVGPLPMIAAFGYFFATGYYAWWHGKGARSRIRVQIENAWLARDLGLANERLATALETAERLSEEDSLTGLFNRRAFQHRALRLREAAGPSATIFLLLVDIDEFHRINEEFGHAVGDGVLQLVADALVQTCGSSALCARWGGEEFLVATTAHSRDSAETIGFRLGEAIEAAGARLGIDGVAVNASIGLSAWTADEALDDAILRADQAMYRMRR